MDIIRYLYNPLSFVVIGVLIAFIITTVIERMNREKVNTPQIYNKYQIILISIFMILITYLGLSWFHNKYPGKTIASQMGGVIESTPNANVAAKAIDNAVNSVKAQSQEIFSDKW